MKSIESVNDFVIKFANVNGTGSASANSLFAKAIFRMGVPVSPKNIFPSNIQGLPTWYEVRVSDKGYLGRRGGVDIALSVNPQSMADDIREVEPGGYFIYDNTKPLDLRQHRNDISIIGLPLTRICNKEYDDPRQRQLIQKCYLCRCSGGIAGYRFQGADRAGGEINSRVRKIWYCPIFMR